MTDIVRLHGHTYVLATSPRISVGTLTLKEGDSFIVMDRFGDTGAIGAGDQGIFHHGTRMVSHHELRLGEHRPLLLSSTVHERNAFVAVDLTNPDIPLGNGQIIQRGVIHIFRSMFLWQGALHCRTRVMNYGDVPLDSNLSYLFDADFADIFEVRGMVRSQRGRQSDRVENNVAILSYDGLDGKKRQTKVAFSEIPTEMNANGVRFALNLKPRQPSDIYHTLSFEDDEQGSPSATSFAVNREKSIERLHRNDACEIFTANEQFNHWINRSSADLHMLISETGHGPYPYAGVPWFSTVFGRDGLITALQCLWQDPGIARGVLQTLAFFQADQDIPAQDAEPGKILHEQRDGEMAATGEVPYARYYGSADSTPLFLMLAGDYIKRTGDIAFAEFLWPHVERALEWIDTYGDLDGDTLVEYARKRPDGLFNQGWKDSDDSISHSDGTLAEPPIALCEVQAYVHAGKRAAAALAKVLGKADQAQRLEAEADALRAKVEESFWMEDLGTYAIALDGHKRPCRVVSSNAGHVLFAGLAGAERAGRVAESLLSPEMFTGWGIRTLSSAEQRYNPMSYHNGSIWPHDNALIGAGLARYGLTDKVEHVLAGQFDAALNVELNRLPELFCGFPRQPGQGPTLYPVACIPQAWASGSVFLLVQACLGLSITADPPRILFRRPHLPAFLPWIELRNLRVGNASVDLRIQRHPQSAGISVLRRDGAVEIRTEM